VIEARLIAVRRATRLGVFTVAWNVAEGAVALVAAGVAGSQALLGFGLDSGVESLSALILLWRLSVERRDPERAEHVERRAVRMIGVTFLVLASFVAADSIRSLAIRSEPEGSPIGIAVTAVSLVVMPLLARRKRAVGREMGSRAVESDSKQTSACAYLSAVVLVGLVANALFGWWWADPAAALVVVGFLVREGVDAMRAERVDTCC
jgi:divalent metal cation (Fe/Co/Zn/Cd) transporter